MRDYSQFDRNLDSLYKDIYPQPVDKAHTAWAKDSLCMIPYDVNTVLDVGAGEGFMQNEFNVEEILYTGLTLGEDDYNQGHAKKNTGLIIGDFTFTQFEAGMFDLVYARHSLEHSPFPLLTLMEWRRISSKYLLLIAPAPEYWGYYGQNHYAVMNEDQLWWLLRRSGWKIVDRRYLRTDDAEFLQFYREEEEDRSKVEYPGPPRIVEYRYLCKVSSPKRT